jgi:CheY-like chemotaxis protein
MLAYAGKGQVSLQRLDANAVVKQTIELLHASVPKDAKLTVELAPNLPPVLADQARLHQVVMNLVINAAEALTSHPRTVRLATRSYILDQETIGRMTFPGEAKPGEFICIEVSDTGTGMSADVIRRIFEPFYTTKFTGRGLGLSAVQGIIRARGGALHVDSQLGQGSTFRAFFPVCAENVGAAGPLNPVGRHNSIRKLTLLLVDDENSVLEVAAHALRRQGHTVYTASNGAHAVTLIQGLSQSVDGVLLDLTMPELDGVSTLHALRALRPNLRVVLMSGYDQQEATRRFDGLGLSGFLQKPFDIQSLREKVNLMANAELV